VDLCVIILPHNIHAEVSVQCSRAGKHVITEKPMCITVRQATRMIEAGKKARKMVTVYHNRRRDGDFKAILHTVQSGIIGDVFHVEMWMGGFSPPRDWWRADKQISGGAFYDWGAHFIDWLLQVVPDKIEYVTGHYHKARLGTRLSNEDHVEAIIRFRELARSPMSSSPPSPRSASPAGASSEPRARSSTRATISACTPSRIASRSVALSRSRTPTTRLGMTTSATTCCGAAT